MTITDPFGAIATPVSETHFLDNQIEEYSRLEKQKPEMIARLLEQRSVIDRNLAMLGFKRPRGRGVDRKPRTRKKAKGDAA